MIGAIENALYDILESEADEKYFIENSELPFLLLFKPYGIGCRKNEFAVYFGRGLGVWHLKRLSEAREIMWKIISKIIAKKDVWLLDRRNRKFKIEEIILKNNTSEIV